MSSWGLERRALRPRVELIASQGWLCVGGPSGGDDYLEGIGAGTRSTLKLGGGDAENQVSLAGCSGDFGGTEIQPQGWGDPNSRPAQVKAQEIEGRSPRPWEVPGPELSQLFHSPLSLSSRGSLVLLHFLPLGWCHLHI